AYIIDAIILNIVAAVLGFILGIGVGAAGGGEDAGGIIGGVFGVVLSWIYFAAMESSQKQATLGKMALGIVVTDEAGGQISFLRATGRYFAKILSALILLIGFIMVAFTERKQGLHDMLASTLVVKGQPGMVGTDPSVFS
ncbi:MAG: RDD family protein, partial [Marinomonas sp.]